MKRCKKCGKHIGLMDNYCLDCEKRLSLKEKVIEGIKKDNFWDTQFHRIEKEVKG